MKNSEAAQSILAKIVNKQKYAGAVKIKALYSSKPEFVAKYANNPDVGLSESELTSLYELLRNETADTALLPETTTTPTVKTIASTEQEASSETAAVTEVEDEKPIPTSKRERKKKEGVVVAEHQQILADTSKSVDEKAYLLFNAKSYSVREIAEMLSTPEKKVSVHSVNYYIKIKHADKTGNEAYKAKFGPGYVWPKKADEKSGKVADPADAVVEV